MTDRATLARAAQRGDMGAFTCLVDLDGPSAYRIILFILRNSPDAEDALQDAILGAWRQLPRLRDPDRWEAWFRRIAVRAAVNTARSNGRWRRAVGLVGGRTEDYATEVVERQDIADALHQFKPTDQALLGLRYGADLTVQDVAAALDIPVGTAKSRLHRALHRLRRLLEETSHGH